MSTFSGDLLTARRHTAQLTPDRLAAAAGVTPVAVAGMEYGDCRPAADIVTRLAGALGCDPGDLHTGGVIDHSHDHRMVVLDARTEAWVAAQVAAAPPMTPERAARISAVMFAERTPGRRRVASRR
jgi:transcriptional regulator with XRE-family HTH domain